MTIRQIIKSAAERLSLKKIPLPHLEAEVLLSEVLKKPAEFLYAHGEKKLTSSQAAGFRALLARRLKGEPAAYITGHKEFYGLDFLVNKNVLIPRPETELMVAEALRIKPRAKHLALIDVGTGSGCVAITLAKLTKQKIIAIDISGQALKVAELNAKRHGVDKQIKFIKGDLLKPILRKKLAIGHWPLVVLANLPYLTPTQIKNSPTIKHEPKLALTGGPDGLNLYRKLAEQVKTFANARLTLFCEIDPAQAAAMKKIFSGAKKFQIKKDLAGLNRLAIIKIKQTKLRSPK